MRIWTVGIVIAFAAVIAGKTEAGIITDPSSFSGNETLVTFSDVATDTALNVAPGVTIQNEATYFAHPSHNSNLNSGLPYGWIVSPSKPGTDGAFRDNTPRSDFSIYFDAPVNRVGMVLSGMDFRTIWTLQAFDVDGNLLESNSVTGISTMIGWNEVFPVFTGLESLVGISRLRVFEDPALRVGFDGQLTIMDDLRFEAFAPVPEPASLAIWALGGIGCVVGAVRRRRKSSAKSAV